MLVARAKRFHLRQFSKQGLNGGAECARAFAVDNAAPSGSPESFTGSAVLRAAVARGAAERRKMEQPLLR
jgi:hypothetical protein